MSQPPATSYDELPYQSQVFYYTHPDRLATLATLFGMQPAQANSCRVLDLGCGTGANLVAIAQSLPSSRCLGIDLSPRQIATGQALIQTLGLSNIELRCLDLQGVDERLGRFDYILAHGVYSWVPPEVQERLLTLCARLLAPHGVAYVSYNTYPGWHLRGMIREMLLYHVDQFSEPRERVRQARAFLEFLNEGNVNADSAYARLLRDEATLLKDTNDAYLYHEHLEAANQPVAFHEFIARAAGHGLQFLSEAYQDALPPALAARGKAILGPRPDLLRQEQYVDFLLNRTFRLTLLCHAAVKLQRPPAPERVLSMHVHGLAQPEAAQPDVASPAVERFRTEDGVALATGAPLYKAALVTLWEALPRALPFETLWARVCTRLAQQPALLENGRAQLAEHVLQGCLSSLLDLHLHEPALTAEVSGRPVANPLARLQASEEQAISNVWHRYVKPSPIHRLLLRYLDGSRDVEALAETMTGLVREGQLTLQHEGQPMRDSTLVRQACRASLGAILQWLARNALLVG